jgi:retron-type reverse transcriptase
MSRICFTHTYDDIISVENLLAAWREFLSGKRKKDDVRNFQYRLSDNMYALHRELRDKTYVHGDYYAFNISDPKPRDIHKASVRDRLLHHAIYRVLYPYFDKTFIHDSYSCRIGKGTHKALDRFRSHAQKSSHNHTRTCWVLKCDIRKFFASIDQTILMQIVATHISDQDILWLLGEVIGSFNSNGSPCWKVGLPLGNLTSQLLVNIYMNEFDQFVKHQLKAKYYVRYADDFVILSHDKYKLEQTLRCIEVFLREKLKLQLHPNKVSISAFSSGVDFLGWVHFPHHRVLRTATKKRMFRRLDERRGSKREEATKQSYVGMLKHGNGRKLAEKIIAG